MKKAQTNKKTKNTLNLNFASLYSNFFPLYLEFQLSDLKITFVNCCEEIATTTCSLLILRNKFRFGPLYTTLAVLEIKGQLHQTIIFVVLTKDIHLNQVSY